MDREREDIIGGYEDDAGYSDGFPDLREAAAQTLDAIEAILIDDLAMEGA